MKPVYSMRLSRAVQYILSSVIDVPDLITTTGFNAMIEQFKVLDTFYIIKSKKDLFTAFQDYRGGHDIDKDTLNELYACWQDYIKGRSG
jgi:hypothetical protein